MCSNVFIIMIMISNFFSISLTFVLYSVFLTKLIVTVVWIALIFLNNSLHSVFVIKLFFTASLVYLNQQEQVLIYQHPIYLLYFSNFWNYLVHFSNYLHQILYQWNQFFSKTQCINTCCIFKIRFCCIIRQI